jgi:hypothetical protein
MKERIIDNHDDDWNVYQKIKQIIRNRQVVYGDMPGLIDEISRIVTQEVDGRIKDRMPSEEEIKEEADLLYSKEIFIMACEWLRSRLTQKTEGGEG